VRYVAIFVLCIFENVIYLCSRTYVESQSVRKVSFADRIDARLQQEQERPRTATLKHVQQHLRTKIEANFAEYVKVL
jgi:hypothetical protein